MVPVEPLNPSIQTRAPWAVREAPAAPTVRSVWVRRWPWLLALALALAVAAWLLLRPRANPGPRFDTVNADRGRVTARVTATGALSALVTVQVGSQVSGRIAELNVDFNSRVTKGMVIGRIDAELFRAALEQARANLEAAKGNLARAEAQAEDAARQAERSSTLADRRLIAPADRDTAVSNAKAARAQVLATRGSVAQALAAAHQAEVNLTYTSIVSPIDGVVISRNVDVGQTVAASLQAPTLFTIAEDLKRMQVDTSVPEADVGKLTAGMKATFSVDAYPGRPFEGRVRQIRNAPQTVQNVVTYDAVIDVDNPDLVLKPGMTANVSFVYADREDVVRLPNAALRFRPPADMGGGDPSARAPGGAGRPEQRGGGANARTAGANGGRPGPAVAGAPGGRTVWRLEGTEPQPVRVETGVTDGSWTELVSGEVNAGDRLIVGIPREASSGAPGGVGGPGGPGGPGGGGMMRRLF
jgi:HlyD family secretion protein